LAYARSRSAEGKSYPMSNNEIVWRRHAAHTDDRLPVSLDEMTLGELLELLRRWPNLPSADRQAILAGRGQTLH
jgi:hypothetical protein